VNSNDGRIRGHKLGASAMATNASSGYRLSGLLARHREVVSAHHGRPSARMAGNDLGHQTARTGRISMDRAHAITMLGCSADLGLIRCRGAAGADPSAHGSLPAYDGRAPFDLYLCDSRHPDGYPWSAASAIRPPGPRGAGGRCPVARGALPASRRRLLTLASTAPGGAPGRISPEPVRPEPIRRAGIAGAGLPEIH